MKIDLSNKTVIVIMGETKHKMLQAFCDRGLLSDNFKVVDALHHTYRYNPSSKYRIMSRMTNQKPVHDNCVNLSVNAMMIRQQRWLNKDSPFDVICLAGVMQTVSQINFLAENNFFNLTTAKRLIILCEVTRSWTGDQLHARNSMKERVLAQGNKFELFYYMSDNHLKEAERFITKFDLPATLPETVIACKSSLDLNPTTHLLWEQIARQSV